MTWIDGNLPASPFIRYDNYWPCIQEKKWILQPCNRPTQNKFGTKTNNIFFFTILFFNPQKKMAFSLGKSRSISFAPLFISFRHKVEVLSRLFCGLQKAAGLLIGLCQAEKGAKWGAERLKCPLLATCKNKGQSLVTMRRGPQSGRTFY